MKRHHAPKVQKPPPLTPRLRLPGQPPLHPLQLLQHQGRPKTCSPSHQSQSHTLPKGGHLPPPSRPCRAATFRRTLGFCFPR
jgi:hypothetical protein